VGRRLSAYLPLHVAHHKGLAFLFDGKIKDNEMRCAILNDPHTIMYMPIEPNESIYPVIHGFDIFGPIISKLIRELTLNPLLLLPHVVHIPKYSFFELR
jgi:hypothetical protein